VQKARRAQDGPPAGPGGEPGPVAASPFDGVVAIGWVASGPDPRRDRLVELAAVVVEHGELTSRYAGHLGTAAGGAADAVAHEDGAGSAGVPAPARRAEVGLADFADFVPAGAICVAHQADVLTGLLRRACPAFAERPILDTLRLSGLCHPELPSHALEFLCQALELHSEPGRGAAPHAEATARLWLHLRRTVLSQPGPVLHGASRLLRGLRNEPLRELFREAAAGVADDRRDLTDLLAESAPTRRRPPPEEEQVHTLDPDAVTSLLDPEGPLAAELGQYEYRDEQVRMAQAVVQAFNASHHLLVEAGTGVGKSVAYLVPAMLWAVVNETPVIVSTNTKNLQAQLVEKDLPLLVRALQADVRFAMIKGRRNYLCLRKLLYLLNHAETELERADRLPLVSVLVWVGRTATGDITESIVGDRPHLRDLASRLTSVAEECRGAECEHRRRCFLQRARRQALAADVVVANHAVVFSEMANPLASPVLPPYRQIILDEAHNLEDAVTSAMSREVSMRRARFVLSRLLRSGTRRRARGLIPSLHWQIGRLRGVEAGLRAEVLAAVEAAGHAVRACDAELGPFFLAMAGLLAASGEVQACRIDPTRRDPARWPTVEAAKDRLVETLAATARTVTALADALVRLGEPLQEALAEFDRELRAAALRLGEFSHDTAAVLGASEPGWVCWVEPAPPLQGGAQAWGAPIHVGALMNEQLYAVRRSVVFTSATMTVNGSPDFVRKRLGIDLIEPGRLDLLTLGTVFNYARQALVLVPLFLPEPDERGRDYATELSAFMVALFRDTGGRGMALFTSHDMLRRCSGSLRRGLAAARIQVFAQGLSGSRESLLRRLRSDPRTVLLGAHSFWEGVDVVGENLSCLVMARLPFAVHTDPVVAARCEAIAADGGNAFLEYSLPSAVIRFRQGFGRLIRHRRDRGVVIIADRRIVSKRYGEWFRASIPSQVYTCSDPAELRAAVRDFLAADAAT